MEFILCISFCLLTFFGKTFSHIIGATEGSNVRLNCSLPGKDLTDQVFDWKKDAEQEVFLYEKGYHYNNGRDGQDEDFKNRVEFFEDKLQSGDASILIKNTKLTDSGNYSCGFPEPMFYHELLVDWILKDRSKEGRNGAFAKPAVSTVYHTHGWALLKCKVLDAYPQPSVVWRDSAGNNVSKNETYYPGKDGHYNIILLSNVTKTDNYTCIAKQAALHHESKEHTHIYIAGSNSIAEGKKTIKFILLLLLVVVDLLLP